MVDSVQKVAGMSVIRRILNLTLCSELVVCAAGYQAGADRRENTVIFRDDSGRTLTIEDLRGATGTFRYELIGSGHVPEQARVLHEAARRAGGQGDYAKAISLLDQAATLAPEWPYPVYDKAFTLLLMQDHAGAKEYYRKTVAMSPRGFFTAMTALDALEREDKGDLPTGT